MQRNVRSANFGRRYRRPVRVSRAPRYAARIAPLPRYPNRRQGLSTRTFTLPPGIGDRVFTKLNYTQQVSLTSTLGSLATQQMSGNSAFDPDFSGVGNQPVGFDQWATFFQKYRVHSSRIYVTPISATATSAATQMFNLVVAPRPDTSTFSTMANAMAANYARAVMFNSNNPSSDNDDISHVMSTTRLFGLPTGRNSLSHSVNYDAAVTADPTNEWTWGIYAATADLGSTSTLICQIRIEYEVEFFLPAQLVLS